MADRGEPDEAQVQGEATGPDPIVDYTTLPSRLQSVGVALAALALVACVVDGAVNGLTFALMARWVGVFLAAMLVATAVTTAVHALGGAGRAGRRGERLASADVGVGPRRLRAVAPEEEVPAEDAAAEDEAPGDRGR